ncbi:phage tail assembly chaperone [Bacillus sp. C1-1]|nr:phage tail assembly chaperone [Bacillus sp. C1-1]
MGDVKSLTQLNGVTYVERQLVTCWRYLRLEPSIFYALTPREFVLLMDAELESIHDAMEREAQIALMHEQASRSKRPKVADLYKRPSSAKKEEHSIQESVKKAEKAKHWLQQFTFRERRERVE